MSYTNLKYHIVFSTKGRRPFLRAPLKARLIEYVGGIIRNLKGVLVEAGGTDDHLHLAAGAHPGEGVSAFVRDIKANSSAWIHEDFPDLTDFAWQGEYAAFSVLFSQLPAVVKYIRGQEEHHRKMTFEEELKLLLTKHGIEFDEKHLLP